MSSRKNQMGAEGILSGRTGAQALNLVTGTPAAAVETAPAPPRPRKKPKARPTLRPPAPAFDPEDRIEPVLVRMKLRHKRALVEEAQRRSADRASAKPGISEVLREVLDAWLEESAP